MADFGLAKLTESDDKLTRSGQVVGTPAYMAPEQARESGQITALSDVYSLGATLYQMLSGRPPFVADTTLETLRKVLDEEPLPLRQSYPTVAADLDTICLKCLEKDPQRRYASAEALADDLAAFLENRPIAARPAATWERTWKWMRRRPAAAGLIGLGVLAPLTLTIVFFVFNLHLSDALTRAEQSKEDLIQRQRQLTDALGRIQEQVRTERDLRERVSNELYLSQIAAADLLRVTAQFTAARARLDECDADHRNWEWGSLRARCQVQAGSLSGPSSNVALAYSADGQRLAIAFLSPEVWIVDGASGERLGDLNCPSRVQCLSFHPNGRWLVTGGADGNVALWDVDRGKILRSFAGHTKGVFAVAFREDGEQLATKPFGYGTRGTVMNGKDLKCLVFRFNDSLFCMMAIGSPLVISRKSIAFGTCRLARRWKRRQAPRPLPSVATDKSRFSMTSGREYSLWNHREEYCESRLPIASVMRRRSATTGGYWRRPERIGPYACFRPMMALKLPRLPDTMQVY